MLFSIIIPAYNVKEYIDKCILSAVNQSYAGAYEVIVIDDGSTDETGSVVDKYKNNPKVSVYHQVNKGLSGTRNFGVSVSKGEFIIYLDGDDWIDRDALSKLAPRCCDADLVVFPMMYYFSEDNILKKSYRLNTQIIYNATSFIHATVGKSLLNITPSVCKAYRRSILHTKGQSFIEGILHEDGPYFADTMANFDKICYIDDGIYYYRQKREGSITSIATIRNFQGNLIGLERFKRHFGTSNKDINYLMSCMCVFNVLKHYTDHAERDVIKYYRMWHQKKFLLKLLFHSKIVVKQQLRLVIMILDPALLRNLMNLLYK